MKLQIVGVVSTCLSPSQDAEWVSFHHEGQKQLLSRLLNVHFGKLPPFFFLSISPSACFRNEALFFETLSAEMRTASAALICSLNVNDDFGRCDVLTSSFPECILGSEEAPQKVQT